MEKGERETFRFLKSNTLSNWFRALGCSPLLSSSLLRRHEEICERHVNAWFKQSKTNPERRITWQSARLQGRLLACTAKRQHRVTAQTRHETERH